VYTECPGAKHNICSALGQNGAFNVTNKDETFAQIQVLLEYQVRVLVEEALFSSTADLDMTQWNVSSGDMVRWVRKMSEISDKEELVNHKMVKFLEQEEMPWIDKLRKKCPGRYESYDDVLQLFYGTGQDDVLSLISRIKQCQTPVKKTRLWSDAILLAIKIIMDAMPPGTEPLGGPDLPQVALFLLCHSGEDIYAHARLADLFTLDYEGYDQETFDLADGGLYNEVHDQYTYNAERRSIYPQMMLIYLVESCELIAASDSETLVLRTTVEEAWLKKDAPAPAEADPIEDLVHTAAAQAAAHEREREEWAASKAKKKEQNTIVGLPVDIWGR